jgi:hypothetical protein
MGHIEQRGAVSLLGGLCQPHAIFGKLAIVGLGFNDPTLLSARSPCETAISIQPARTVCQTVKASLCKIEHCAKPSTAKFESALLQGLRARATASTNLQWSWNHSLGAVVPVEGLYKKGNGNA